MRLGRRRRRHSHALMLAFQGDAEDAGAAPGDWVIDGPDGHGIAGLVNLFGIESPGLTAALAIADEVVAQL